MNKVLLERCTSKSNQVCDFYLLLIMSDNGFTKNEIAIFDIGFYHGKEIKSVFMESMTTLQFRI
jgi:hypothetical protein